MPNSSLIIKTSAVVFILGGLAAAELFYFRFHTIFQRQEVYEAPRVQESVSPSAAVEANQIIAEGSFVGIDAVHKGSGTAKIIQQNNESYLRFENFSVTNGPDLYVYLSDSKTPGNTLASLGNYTNLGTLKGNIGDQNYDIPTEHASDRTVIIWCQQFGVLFSFAVME